MSMRHPRRRPKRQQPQPFEQQSKKSSKPEPLRYVPNGNVMAACGICGPLVDTDDVSELARVSEKHRIETGHHVGTVHPLEPVYRPGEEP